MSNHAKQLSKLNEGLTALSTLVQESLPGDSSQDRVAITAEVSKSVNKHADKLVNDKARILESNLAASIEEKVKVIDNKYATLNQQVAKMKKPEFLDREISGNKINGGMITNFSSRGILDEATDKVLRVTNDAVVVSNIKTNKLLGDVTVEGNLTTTGVLKARSIKVDEVTSDVRLQRTSPLYFEADENGSISNKGLLWKGNGHTKQFVFLPNPDRLFSSESLDLFKGNDYKIANQTVLSATSLGTGVVDSNLKTVGVLKNLRTTGSMSIDEFIFYDHNTNRLGIGTDEPNGELSIRSFDHEFVVINDMENLYWQMGTYSSTGMQIITDGAKRITVGKTGHIHVHSPARFETVSINGATNDESVKLNVNGTIAQNGKKFEVGDTIPTTGAYSQGDIVWNSSPQSKGYVGWICIRSGTPGEWKTFGAIS